MSRCQKRPVYMAKETYYTHKRDLRMYLQGLVADTRVEMVAVTQHVGHVAQASASSSTRRV
jgi:hypothetical protein